MIIKNIVTLTLNDLAIAFKNKTIYLIFFIPFFIFLSLKFIDQEAVSFQKIRLGVVQTEIYAPLILQAIILADRVFTISRITTEEEGLLLLKEKKIDGLLLRSDKNQNKLVLVVLKKESISTISMVENLAVLQRTVEGNSASWISEIKSLQTGAIQKQSLPIWILMIVLLVGFIIIPAQVAEEKEKNLLLALLQTPMREIEWLLAKLFSGVILIFMAVISLHLLSNFNFENNLNYFVLIGIGGFCFSAYGVFLGLLCRNQASARTLGVIFYLPHLLPSALSDFSKKLNIIAPFLPSYHFYESIKSILFNEYRISKLSVEWSYLFLVGLLTFCFSYLLIKKRYSM
ncbi:MAG: ABC transporter permease [Oligoflexia bacterium]|nr:ABC transporter permease [Oligoflexia bacterium]MBF0365344.1 ABC transporter permease [Oligoflexia bacterium]